jgi:predicted dehydrogenase
MREQLNKVRAGVIGAGFIGPVHIEALKRNGIQVTAVCADQGAAVVAPRWNIPTVYTNFEYDQLVRLPDVDVVHITTPNKYHHAHCVAAIKAGKHVVCEKPLGMTAKETAELVKLGEKNPDQIFAVNYNLRFYPAVLQMRADVAAGRLGEIIHINGSYFQDWLLKKTDFNWRLLPEEGGKLRAIADIGTHWMDAASFVLGQKIGSVYAHLDTYHKNRERPIGDVQTYAKVSAKQKFQTYEVKTEDYASVLLRWENGVHGNLGVSQVAAGRKNSLRLEIYGSERSVWWESEDPNTLYYGSRDGANAVSLRGAPGFSEDTVGFTDYPGGHAEGFPDAFKMCFRAIYTDVVNGRSKKPLYATVQDGHHEVKLCEAILKSSEKKKWINV